MNAKSISREICSIDPANIGHIAESIEESVSRITAICEIFPHTNTALLEGGTSWRIAELITGECKDILSLIDAHFTALKDDAEAEQKTLSV